MFERSEAAERRGTFLCISGLQKIFHFLGLYGQRKKFLQVIDWQSYVFLNFILRVLVGLCLWMNSMAVWVDNSI